MDKVLYISSKGAIHDYRFLSKLSKDYEVTYLHYSSNEIIKEIKKLEINIIEKKPIISTFPLLSELIHLKKVYNDFKPDIVHTGYVWQVGILAAVLNLHPHLSMPYGSDILLEPEKNLFLKILVNKVMNQCDHIQCDAESVKRKIIRDYGINKNKISVFARGIDLDTFSPRDKLMCRKKLGLGENLFIVIFNRHLAPIYGITDLLEGFKIFSKNKNDVLLLLVTDGILKNKVINYIKDNNLKLKISLVGRVPNRELPLYLNAADVYITTSLSDGTSLSFLEAMATGHGIIATDVPSIMELAASDNILIAQRNSPKSVNEALENYYNNRHLIAKHGAINKQIASDKADWNKNYLKLKEIYNMLLSN